jgi:hypothetical protein
MLYYDFDWDLDQDGIILDKEISIEKLGWKKGDYFRLVECDDGRVRLARANKLEEFILKGADNGSSGND